MCPAASPKDAITNENSLIWARLFAGGKLTQCPSLIKEGTGKIARKRLATGKGKEMLASKRMGGVAGGLFMPRARKMVEVGSGICMVKATKNKVTKKSRILTTFATISTL